MRKEEREVMPLAQKVLSSQDRADIEAAFASHRDPLAGASPETHHDQLFQRIVMLVPALLGLGAPLEDEDEVSRPGFRHSSVAGRRGTKADVAAW